MEQVLSLTIATLGQLAVDPLFWLVVVLVALLYRGVEGARRKVFGAARRGAFLRETAVSTLWGLAGGLAGSFAVVLAGVVLPVAAFLYIWPLAIILMLIDVRFLCFSYAGGVVALANLIFGWPAVDAARLLALVAVLHLVESLLILACGHRGVVPAYVPSKRDGVVGGFVLQKFWPLPFVIPVAGGGLLPVVAGLGYGDLALSRTPARKSRLQFALLFTYSLVLLALAAGSPWQPGLLWAAALFSPLGHEGVIYLGRRLELAGAPRWTRPAHGVRVLDVWPGSPFWRAGVRSGDVIAEAGDRAVDSRPELWAAVDRRTPLDVVFFRDRVFNRTVLFPPGDGWRVPGLVTVPEPGDEPTLVTGTAGPVVRWLRAGLTRWRK